MFVHMLALRFNGSRQPLFSVILSQSIYLSMFVQRWAARQQAATWHVQPDCGWPM